MPIALYAGTFDPITRGHLSVIERGARLFERLIVLIAVNPNKRPLFSTEERAEMVGEATAQWPNVTCTSTAGFVVDVARELGARYLIRGVRGCTDVEGEILLAHMNRELAPDIETVFVPAHPELSEVSSSKLKALASQGLDVSQYCPPEIEARLVERLQPAVRRKMEVADGQV
jgi:pantetheine-phosphate adenylyltransferase